jgi:pSer/pThr/pTyr-binding forkhead associated (FHA) protein
VWTVVIDSSRGERHEVSALAGQPITIGRAPGCDVMIDRTGTVARRHCQLTVDERGEMRLVDLGSSGGTFLGRARIHGLVRVAPQDRITVGDVTLWVARAPTRKAPAPLGPGLGQGQ